MNPAPDPDPGSRIAAALLLLRAHRAGVSLSWAPRMEPVYRADATGAEVAVGVRPVPGGELRFKADPPTALTPELRAEIAAHRDALLALLAPWLLPLNGADPLEKFALIVAREDPAWTQSPLAACVACGRSTIWTAPGGDAMHPECDPLLGVL
jgi:hypothetical protein